MELITLDTLGSLSVACQKSLCMIQELHFITYNYFSGSALLAATSFTKPDLHTMFFEQLVFVNQRKPFLSNEIAVLSAFARRSAGGRITDDYDP